MTFTPLIPTAFFKSRYSLNLKLIKVCILYNQREATYTMFFIIISALHVSGSFSAHHQELIKLYVQPWILSCFPAGVVGVPPQPHQW